MNRPNLDHTRTRGVPNSSTNLESSCFLHRIPQLGSTSVEQTDGAEVCEGVMLIGVEVLGVVLAVMVGVEDGLRAVVILAVTVTVVEVVIVGVGEKLFVDDGEAPMVNDAVGVSELVVDGVAPIDREAVGVIEIVGDADAVTEGDGDRDSLEVGVAVAVAVADGGSVVSTIRAANGMNASSSPLDKEMSL